MTNELVRGTQLLDIRVTPGRLVSLCRDKVAVQLLVDMRPRAKGNGGTRPLDIRFVLDRSGSMSEPAGTERNKSKIEVVCEGVARIVGELSDADQAMLVTFNQAAETVFGRQPMRNRARQAFAEAIRNIKADGSTRFSEALAQAMSPPPIHGAMTRLVFLTDGESTCDRAGDYERIEKLAAASRDLNAPWGIYGTGISYNWSFLEQQAHRCAPGSYVFHVMDLASLEGHLLGELAFLRGIAIDRLVVSGQAVPDASVGSVTRFMPAQADVDHGEGAFEDGSGAIDVFRGQQYLIELVVRRPQPGMRKILTLTLRGRSFAHGYAPFEQRTDVPLMFTDDPERATAPNPEIVSVLQRMAANRLAREGKLLEAADLFERAGDDATAVELRTLCANAERGDTDVEDAQREATTVVGRNVTEHFTVRNPRPLRRG